MTRLLFPLLIFLTSCQEKKTSSTPIEQGELIPIKAERPLMGTLFRITIYTDELKEGYLAMEEAFDLAEKFGDRATDYHPDSELNKLTRSPLNTPIKVSEKLFQVLLLGQKLAAQSDGIFDPTYGPLTHLWRTARRTDLIPSPEEIAEARPRCGIHHLRFDEKNQSITVLRHDLQLDLGGIAKGFAADLIFDHLHEQGFSISLVTAGGDLRIGDPPPEKKGWAIGLKTFRLTPTSSISLKNCAVSTSGDLYQNIISEGKKYSHLIDHRTGLGLTTLRAASIILPEAKLTDPLATIACLSDDPKSLLQHYPKASIRVIYEDREIPPITTGIFTQ